jgi:hypothetical protein
VNSRGDDGDRRYWFPQSDTEPLGDAWTDQAREPQAAAAEIFIPPDELAAAIAEAMRGMESTNRRRRSRAQVDASGLTAATWALIAGGAALGGIGALVLGAVLGLALGGYLAAPNRAVEVGGYLIALLGGARGALTVRRAVRAGSWNRLGGAALDFALALCAAALATGMRP